MLRCLGIVVIALVVGLGVLGGVLLITREVANYVQS